MHRAQSYSSTRWGTVNMNFVISLRKQRISCINWKVRAYLSIRQHQMNFFSDFITFWRRYCVPRHSDRAHKSFEVLWLHHPLVENGKELQVKLKRTPSWIMNWIAQKRRNCVERTEHGRIAQTRNVTDDRWWKEIQVGTYMQERCTLQQAAASRELESSRKIMIRMRIQRVRCVVAKLGSSEKVIPVFSP